MTENLEYKKVEKILKKIALTLAVFLALYFLLLGAPLNFAKNTISEIPKGVSIGNAAQILASDRIIFSPTLFKVIFKISGRNVVAGKYLFDDRENIFMVAARISAGDFGFKKVKITFPEGITVADEAKICSSFLPLCKASEFELLARGREGYFFPDTYFFLESADAREVVQTMNDNFKNKITALKSEVNGSGHSLNDIVVMSSIVEREGKTVEDRRMVAGILWKRLKLGMPLQADATFGYININGIPDTTDAILAIDSPYNTYKNRGLPPTPICNPGIESIRATLEPISSPYLYYLSDKTGVFHYAETFTKHIMNEKKYLQ